MPDERKPYDSAKDLLTLVHALARITRGRGEEVERVFDHGASERKLRRVLQRFKRQDVEAASDGDDDIVSDWGDRGTGSATRQTRKGKMTIAFGRECG